MRAAPTVLLAILAFVSAPLAIAAGGAKNIFANTPFKSPSYPGFNDAGQRTYLIAGEQGVIVSLSPWRVDIRGLSFTQYPGDGSVTVQTAITATSATATIEEDNKNPRITGRENVRLVHANELDATGEDWAYDHEAQKLTINKNARITYKSPLKNILGNSAPAHPGAGPTSPRPAPETGETLITADTLELAQNAASGITVATLRGNVTVTTTDGLRLVCDHLEVTAARLLDKNPALTAADKFERLVATGNVSLSQGARTVTCGRADLRPREDQITLTQNALVTDTAVPITAAGDPLTLHRLDRRIEGRQGRFTLPPRQPGAGATLITADSYVMWETPDGLTHATLDENVTAVSPDTRLACDHLELTVTPEKQSAGSASPAAPATETKTVPLQHLLATGNVRLEQASREVTGGRAEVLPLEDKITLTQNPVIIDRAINATATGDIFVLNRLGRRLTGENVSVALPPLKDLSPAASKNPPPAAGASQQPADTTPTTITGRRLAMWTTDDGISHATLEHDVRLAATNLALACNHLALDADPARQTPPPPAAAENNDLDFDPKLEAAASKILSILATGAVRFTQLTREAACETADINPPGGRITLTGKPLIIDRRDPPLMITGEPLVLNRGEHEITGKNITITPAPASVK